MENLIELVKNQARAISGQWQEAGEEEKAWWSAAADLAPLEKSDAPALARLLAQAIYQDINYLDWPWAFEAAYAVLALLYPDAYWAKAVLAAKETGRYGPGQAVLARDWETCACGRADSRIETWDNGMPKDITLRENGEAFCRNVKHNEVGLAAVYLVCIEMRAADLLAGTESGK